MKKLRQKSAGIFSTRSYSSSTSVFSKLHVDVGSYSSRVSILTERHTQYLTQSVIEMLFSKRNKLVVITRLTFPSSSKRTIRPCILRLLQHIIDGLWQPR